jgi:hypothetical protein
MRSVTGAARAPGSLSKSRTVLVLKAFGKNTMVKNEFWTLFEAMAGLVLARVVDPVINFSRWWDYYEDRRMRLIKTENKTP